MIPRGPFQHQPFCDSVQALYLVLQNTVIIEFSGEEVNLADEKEKGGVLRLKSTHLKFSRVRGFSVLYSGLNQM